jgi:hypothetical protein
MFGSSWNLCLTVYDGPEYMQVMFFSILIQHKTNWLRIFFTPFSIWG